MAVTIAGFKILDEKLFTLNFLREIIAELFGTFLLVMFVGMTVYATTVNSDAKVVRISLAVGLGIGGIVHLFSDISGGQLNPAVSFALFFGRVLSLYRAAIFSVAQIIGAIIGGALLKGVYDAGNNIPGVVSLNKINTGQGFFLEFIGTLFLVLTVLSSVNSKRLQSPSYLQPFAIGVSIAVAHFYLVPTTGAGINPARSLGTNVVASAVSGPFWIYVLAPMLASIVGGLLYEFVFNSFYDVTSTYMEGSKKDNTEGESGTAASTGSGSGIEEQGLTENESLLRSKKNTQQKGYASTATSSS